MKNIDQRYYISLAKQNVRRHSSIILLSLLLIILLFGEGFQFAVIHTNPIIFVKIGSKITSCGDYETAELCGQMMQNVLLYSAFWFLNIIMCATVAGIGISVLHLEQHYIKGNGMICILNFSLILGIVLFLIAVVSRNTIGGGKLDALLGNTLGGLYNIPPFRDHPGAFISMSYATNAFVPISASIIGVACLRSAHRLQSARNVHNRVTSPLAELAGRLRGLKRATLAAALLLGTAVLEFQAYLQLPLPFLRAATMPQLPVGAPPPASSIANAVWGGASGYKSISDGLIAIQGIEYTVLLIVVFGIPAIMLHHNAILTARKEAPKNVEGMTPYKYMEQFGLVFSPPTYLADLVTVAIPVVAASISPLIRIGTSAG
jgi:hypothetical protein